MNQFNQYSTYKIIHILSYPIGMGFLTGYPISFRALPEVSQYCFEEGSILGAVYEIMLKFILLGGSGVTCESNICCSEVISRSHILVTILVSLAFGPRLVRGWSRLCRP